MEMNEDNPQVDDTHTVKTNLKKQVVSRSKSKYFIAVHLGKLFTFLCSTSLYNIL